jgi:hypothetical protein
LAVWESGVVHVYKAEFAESLAPQAIASLHGIDAQERAHPDRPSVQLRLRLDA